MLPMYPRGNCIGTKGDVGVSGPVSVRYPEAGALGTLSPSGLDLQ
jgi:hypothetical protein